jgi:hypothetical protein
MDRTGFVNAEQYLHTSGGEVIRRGNKKAQNRPIAAFRQAATTLL